MEKVKITKEQLDALIRWRMAGEVFEAFLNERGSFVAQYKSLNNVTPEEFSLMLNGWYEVDEPPFKVGDWVFDKVRKVYRKVRLIGLYECHTSNEVSVTYVNQNKVNFEKVGEPWKIMLLDLGREKPEFVKGDGYLYQGEETESYRVINNTSHDMHVNAFENGIVIEFFPKRDGIKLQGGN